MRYGPALNKLLLDNQELSEEQKAETVKELLNEDQFSLLQNIESYPSKYSREVQRAVVSTFNARNIFLF